MTPRRRFLNFTYGFMWMLLFLLLPLGGLAYVIWHLWCLLPLAAGWKWAIAAFCTLSFLLLFVNLSRLLDRLPLWLATVCYEVGSSSVFVLLYAVMLFLLLDLGRLVHLVPRHWLYQNGHTAVAVLVLLVVVFGAGYAHYMNKVRQPITVTTKKPLAHDLKIVLMSDLHLGYHNRRAEFAKWVDRVNAEKPDLVLIAGDIIDGSLRPLREEGVAEEFKRIKAPVYACLGNHEYYASEPLSQQFCREAGITLLRDSSVSAKGIRIVGRDDRTNPDRKPLRLLTEKADLESFTILLDHQPHHLEEAEQAGIDFQFSGHTHRGQVWPISWITDAIYEKSFGPYRRGGTQYYVSSGIGIWGGKFRIGTRSEYVVLELSAER